MTAYNKSSRWAAALAFGLAGLIAVGAAMLLAAPARPAVNAFELTVDGRIEPNPEDPEYGLPPISRGTFRSGPPFCATGTFIDLGAGGSGVNREFTCDDGTGGLTVSITHAAAEYTPELAPWGTSWRILNGRGSYTDLRGKGSLLGELLSGGFPSLELAWRSTFRGTVDRDAVAPTINLSSAKAAKLRRPAGAYAIKLALALRDDVQGNAVSYTVSVTAVRTELARKFGTATTPTVPMTLRIWPQNARVKKVRIKVVAVDPVGNSVSFRRVLTLPR